MPDPNEKIAHLPQQQRDDKVFNVEWTVNIGKDRQARILTDFPQSGDPKLFHDRLDQIDAALTRQKARHEIVELEELIVQAEEQAATFQADHDEAERDHQRKIIPLDAKLEEARRLAAVTDQEARQDHARSDKRGAYKPGNITKQRLDRMEKTAAEVQADKDKLEAERTVALNNLQVNLRRQQKLIARLRKQVEQKRAITEERA
jgi:hypothetical protein